ncbi:MAG: transcriptional repressor LexA [Planctomycetes bacterium]|nr:transcriptional repressor LexA [Planctomycetota bacterium]
MAALTPKQKQVLRFLEAYIGERGLAPTYEEIGDAIGTCKVTVLAHLQQLEKKGLIRRVPYASRAIELCGGRARIPVVGAIQAGFPILAFEEAEKEDLRDLLPLGGDLFALRVKGQSMVEDHIQDGDLVVVARTAGADPGGLVVALVDGEEATLKRFYPEGARVRLEPANATFEPIVLPRERVRIQGRVVGVLRLYR